MIEFKLPSLGADMDEGTLLQWRVLPGDAVKRGQVVAVVDTSKAAVDVEIWQDGVVAELLTQPGQKIPIGTVMATLREPGETVAPARAVASAPATVPTPTVVPAKGPTTEHAPEPQAGSTTARQLVSPSARQRAKELGIDPNTVLGTGAQASVTLADIEAAARLRGAKSQVSIPGAVPASPAVAPDRQKEMRKAIAAAMSRSKREIPHYYLGETIPMDAALTWLQQRNEGLPITERILPAVLQLKAVALALQRVPQLNGFCQDGVFEQSTAVHAGVAISLRGGGLVAPAIHDVATKPLEQLMRELADLVKRARSGSLRSSEMSDPTITITNLGDQGVESVFGVIYPPQVALVGFGSVAVRPWVKEGELRALALVTASLAADHRVSDGHLGARFLAELRELLQQPQLLADAGGVAPISQGVAA
jgi:pyruvate dehydrogenase E2 component (dihydrolipoamide acetyltransferase)